MTVECAVIVTEGAHYHGGGSRRGRSLPLVAKQFLCENETNKKYK